MTGATAPAGVAPSTPRHGDGLLDVGHGPQVEPDGTNAIVTLAEVVPTVLTGSGTVTVSGTVTAPTRSGMTGGSVDLVLGKPELTVRDDVSAWAAATGAVDGRVLGSVDLAEVAPGKSAGFTVEVPQSSLRQSTAFAAVPIAVRATSGKSGPSGTTRTFLAWNSVKEFVPLDLAIALPVTLNPDPDLFIRDADTRTGAWLRAIGPGSRIDRIIDATRGQAITLAVDPVVLTGERPGGTAGGSSPEVTPTPDPTATGRSTGDADADADQGTVSSLATRIRTALQDRSVWVLPYADADLAASADAAPNDPIVRSLLTRAAGTAEGLGATARADVVWPVDGRLSPTREKRLGTVFTGTPQEKPAAVVVDADTITGNGAYTPSARRVTADGTRLLGSDSRLSALLPTRADETPVLMTQQFLAESLVLLGELPGTPRTALVTGPRGYDPAPGALAQFMDAIGEADWLRLVSADALLPDSRVDPAVPVEKPDAPEAGPTTPRPVLTAGRLAEMARQKETVQHVASVLRDGETFEATYGELIDELTSTRWRYDPQEWEVLSESVRTDTKAATSAIRIAGQKVNFLAESGTLRVTVENGLDYAVENLRLVLTPTNPRVQVVEQPAPITIAAGPGAKQSVTVQIRAVAAGPADINATLTTLDGTAIGSPAVIRVAANPLDSTIYWVGGILVGLVLLFGIGRSLIKGTPRIDEIGDLEDVAQRDEAAQHRNED